MLLPAQVLVFLVNSKTRELSLPPDRLQQIVSETNFLLLQWKEGKLIACMIRKMSAAILAVYPAPLHCRSLQALKQRALRKWGYEKFGGCKVGSTVVDREYPEMKWKENLQGIGIAACIKRSTPKLNTFVKATSFGLSDHRHSRVARYRLVCN